MDEPHRGWWPLGYTLQAHKVLCPNMLAGASSGLYLKTSNSIAHPHNPTQAALDVPNHSQEMHCRSGEAKALCAGSCTLGAMPSPVAELPSFGQPSVQAVPVPCPALSQLLLLCCESKKLAPQKSSTTLHGQLLRLQKAPWTSSTWQA